MTKAKLLINGRWVAGNGPEIASQDPATGEVIWQAASATEADVADAVASAKQAQADWAGWSMEERISLLHAFAKTVDENASDLAELISRETGKPLWDARGEVGAMVRKVDISVQAFEERTGSRLATSGAMRHRLAHRPHGVMAVFGPYNFPGHLPNGHIVPALLAGNTVVFKPSELTPLVAEKTLQLWRQAGLPSGVINLVQGARETGVALAGHPDVDGILFTGSVPTGQALHRQLAGQPEKILALELGGNNPLIVQSVEDLEAAALMIVQSSYITSGQRCTCARRLIIPKGAEGDRIIEALTSMIDRLRLGAWNDSDTPFLGPVVSEGAAARVVTGTKVLAAQGGEIIRDCTLDDRGPAFVRPGLIDVTDVNDRPDEEIFGPLLQVIRTRDFNAAMAEANATRFGLAAGLLSDDQTLYDRFYAQARAGIVNWNRPLTGAASDAPFGGIGLSGNHRPSAYYAADYCAWPVASLEAADNRVVTQDLPAGITPAN